MVVCGIGQPGNIDVSWLAKYAMCLGRKRNAYLPGVTCRVGKSCLIPEYWSRIEGGDKLVSAFFVEEKDKKRDVNSAMSAF